MNKVYQKIRSQWKFIGYNCTNCKKPIQEINMISHEKSCGKVNTTSTKEKFMPVQAVMKNGERYYRWGNEGKLYKNREDAEKQGRAAYASGYKTEDKSPKKKG